MTKVFENIVAVFSLGFGLCLFFGDIAPTTGVGMGILGILLGLRGIGTKFGVLAFAGVVLCMVGIYRTGLLPGTAKKEQACAPQAQQVRQAPQASTAQKKASTSSKRASIRRPAPKKGGG